MKSVYNHLKEPIAHYLKKDILKEGIKVVSTFTPETKVIEIEDKIDIHSNSHLYKQQIPSYKPSVLQQNNNDLNHEHYFKLNNSIQFGIKKVELTNLVYGQFSTKVNRMGENIILKPKIEQGVNFEELVTKSTIFVDKSLFIKEILDDPSKAILITMPRRWGKSINMDMLKRFLNIKVDGSGNPLKNEDRVKELNYKLFAGGEFDYGKEGKRQYQSTAINDVTITSKNTGKEINAMEYQGQFPVIFIDFKDCDGDDYTKIENNVRSKILETVENFGYLENSNKIYKTTTVTVGKKYSELLNKIKESDFSKAIKELTELLCTHHDKKVWILVDEYDAPINHAFMKFQNPTESNKVMDLFKDIFSSALKGNDYLEKGVLTGVNRIAKASLFSGLNSLTEYDFQSHQISKYYGLDQLEVDSLLEHFNLSGEKERVKYWYNGYKNHEGNEGRYNIWSTIKFLNDTVCSNMTNKSEVVTKAYKPYWVDSGSNFDNVGRIFENNKELKDKIKSILEGTNNSISYTKSFSAKDFQELKKILDADNTIKVDPSGIDLVLSYLTHMGYFISNQTNNGTEITVANNEIRTIFVKYLLNYCEKQYNFSESDFNTAANNFDLMLKSEKHSDLFTKSFDNLLTKINISKINEHAIHDIFFTVCSKINRFQLIGSDITFGTEGIKNRADVVIIDRNQKIGVIIEIKHNLSVQDALNQINSKNYIGGFKENNTVVEIIKIGFNVNTEKDIKSEILISKSTEN